MKTGTIYMLVFPDGEGYVGQTQQDLDKRFNGGRGYNPETPIGKAIEKHGWHNVKVEVLYRDIPVNELRRYETLCITRYGTHHNGLNCDIGKDHVSDEQKTKISKAMTGREFSKEHRARISENNAARRPEVRAKISKAHKGKKKPYCVGEKNPTKRPEVRAKISKAKKKSIYAKKRKERIKNGQGVLFRE